MCIRKSLCEEHTLWHLNGRSITFTLLSSTGGSGSSEIVAFSTPAVVEAAQNVAFSSFFWLGVRRGSSSDSEHQSQGGQREQHVSERIRWIGWMDGWMGEIYLNTVRYCRMEANELIVGWNEQVKRDRDRERGGERERKRARKGHERYNQPIPPKIATRR